MPTTPTLEDCARTLHHLNRRAKHEDHIAATIYASKEAFCRAAVCAAVARIEYFDEPLWLADGLCYDCGDDECQCAWRVRGGRRWHIVEIMTPTAYRFHVPPRVRLARQLCTLAKLNNVHYTEVPPHDPTQPQRDFDRQPIVLGRRLDLRAQLTLLTEQTRMLQRIAALQAEVANDVEQHDDGAMIAAVLRQVA